MFFCVKHIDFQCNEVFYINKIATDNTVPTSIFYTVYVLDIVSFSQTWLKQCEGQRNWSVVLIEHEDYELSLKIAEVLDRALEHVAAKKWGSGLNEDMLQ